MDNQLSSDDTVVAVVMWTYIVADDGCRVDCKFVMVLSLHFIFIFVSLVALWCFSCCRCLGIDVTAGVRVGGDP